MRGDFIKTLIACYSFTGNTWKISEEVKNQMGADITRIMTVEQPNWDMKCMSEWLEERADIKPCTTDMSKYDCLILATPVWAWLAPPAVNEYIAQLKNCKGKKFAVITTAGKCGFEDVINEVKDKLEQKGMEFIGAGKFYHAEISCGDYRTRAKEFVESVRLMPAPV
ncbi:hypothetical protein CUJ83_10215 [Methanocella sp. CWC-04]|uniref:Flavodoxin-like domain-containing protein n=1 Tax=Methanooceanicella nereidis TaxID=2052831 RepID=A0AAP2RDY0_9EURY|nr:NAD(P)H-dependent oxidoreductase [Methanocella sp. CWC-04]MCD1295372.1 hypothetical protein [Methanocella sp. CWC-04]